MTAVTPTWEIPYAEPTDPFCDGCTITEDMAQRVDDILAEFEASLDAAQVIPLARASRLTVQEDVPAAETLEFTAVDFDTTGIGSLSAPVSPIRITSEGRWMLGGMILWDHPSATSGIFTMRVNSVTGLDSTWGYRQRVPGIGADISGTTAWLGTGSAVVDLIYVQGPANMRAIRSWAWAFRIGDA